MDINPTAFNAGLTGIQAGQRKVDQAAFDIARQPVTPAEQGLARSGAAQDIDQTRRPELTQSLIEQRVGEHEVQANAKVIKTADEALGTLIDTRA